MSSPSMDPGPMMPPGMFEDLDPEEAAAEAIAAAADTTIPQTAASDEQRYGAVQRAQLAEQARLQAAAEEDAALRQRRAYAVKHPPATTSTSHVNTKTKAPPPQERDYSSVLQNYADDGQDDPADGSADDAPPDDQIDDLATGEEEEIYDDAPRKPKGFLDSIPMPVKFLAAMFIGYKVFIEED